MSGTRERITVVKLEPLASDPAEDGNCAVGVYVMPEHVKPKTGDVCWRDWERGFPRG